MVGAGRPLLSKILRKVTHPSENVNFLLIFACIYVISCERDAAGICCQVLCWWCTHGAQPQTRRTSELQRSHDGSGTDRRTDAKSYHIGSVPYTMCIVRIVRILAVTSVPTLRDVATLCSSLPPSHISSRSHQSRTPVPFERDVIYGRPLP